ncbi:MAG TPA: IS1182 family transposase [Geminicoccaceae bacterium]|nr:IS1182 family transposase [Geminicoccaceae bacterium]
MSLHPEPVGTIPAETARVARAAFPKGTVVMRLRDEFGALYEDEDFAALYPGRGQSGLPPWRLALVTVLQFLELLSDRQAADAVRARIDWKYALGLELTDRGFHFSVLAEFRARLVAGGAEHLLLDRMLERFRARGLVKARGKQRTDSTHVLAAVHDLHLLELVAETLRAALDDLAAIVPDWLRAIARPDWFERYGRRVEDYRLPKRRAEREALALAVGADGLALLDALDAPDAPAAARAVPMVATLRHVWRVHYAREEDGRPRWRAGSELPPVGERLQSPYDPEAHYSTKRQMEWSGYKVHVTETCDEDAAHLVTHVLTCPAMQPDMASTADIHQRLADKGLLPAEHFVDAAYVDAALLVGSRRDHGVSLEGPVRAMPRRPSEAEQAYEQRHFAIDWERERVTCPQGKTSVTWRAGLDEVGAPRIQAVFSRTDCGACAARHLCTPAKAARRSVYFHPRAEYEALNAARVRMHDPAWKERYRVRAGVEGTLSQGVRAFGMRRSRYIGIAKTGLQQACTAAAMNALRAVRWLAGTARARTRITRFAALAQAA